MLYPTTSGDLLAFHESSALEGEFVVSALVRRDAYDQAAMARNKPIITTTRTPTQRRLRLKFASSKTARSCHCPSRSMGTLLVRLRFSKSRALAKSSMVRTPAFSSCAEYPGTTPNISASSFISVLLERLLGLCEAGTTRNKGLDEPKPGTSDQDRSAG